jgi:hypothetical protein
MMEKVDLGGKRERVEMVEMPGYQTLAPKENLDEWMKKFKKMDEWIEIGIDHRIDVRGNEDAKTILGWLWGTGVASFIQRTTAANLSITQFTSGPQVFHKYNIKRGGWDWAVDFGKVGENPLFKKYKDEDTDVAPEVYEPDVFMQWSGDANYPFSFAHLDTAEEVCAAFTEHGVKQIVYPLDAQNIFFVTRENYPRIAFLLGVINLEIPGRQIRDKHRYVYEKPNLVMSLYTPREKELIAKTEQISAAKKFGLEEKFDNLLAKLKKGEAPELERKPGVRTWFANEFPHDSTIRRTLQWWDKHETDEIGFLKGFGEFEADEFKAMLEELGYKEIDEERIFGKSLKPTN